MLAESPPAIGTRLIFNQVMRNWSHAKTENTQTGGAAVGDGGDEKWAQKKGQLCPKNKQQNQQLWLFKGGDMVGYVTARTLRLAK